MSGEIVSVSKLSSDFIDASIDGHILDACRTNQFRFFKTSRFRCDSHTDPRDYLPGHYETLSVSAEALEQQIVGMTNSGLVHVRWYGGFARVTGAGASVKEAEGLVEEISLFLRDFTDRGLAVTATWFYDGYVHDAGRHIPRSSWSDLQRNYPLRTRQSIDSLVKLSRPREGGKLILWHGPPGTGKSRALAALANEWAEWCTFRFVVDPDRLFADPDYLVKAAEPPAGPSDPARARWQVLVAEDADEYLRSEARRTSQGALGRLLNVTDGVVGTSSRTLVLLTTNEDVGLIDPALTRPGRCYARIAFDLFSPEEAHAWLPEGYPRPAGDVSLAHLYANGGQR